MVDRVSTFSDEETLELLRTRFIAFAPSLTELLKSGDSAGDFFRKVVNQRIEPKHSKQGYYVCSPDGTLLKGWMYPRPDDGTMKRTLKAVLETWQAPKQVEPLDATRVDRGANPLPPAGAVVVEVFAKLLEANWQPTRLERFSVIRGAIGRDRLWVTKAEVQELQKNAVPDSLLERMIRFNLVDSSRGVPAPWRRGDLNEVQVKAVRENGALRLEGTVRLEEANRRYEAKVQGAVEFKGESISRFDVLVLGVHNA
ncbi:MAG TPA: hypothetical protein VJB14_17125, partial [Planctomycetota bacterium]|nr:hypothetical protein [Planctomycetota bacterium]